MTKTIAVQNGISITLMSHTGREWFMHKEGLDAFEQRKADLPKLSDRQKGWLNMIELPSEIHDTRIARRMSRVE